MSMHEIEAIIEDSVLLLNDSKNTQQEKRELFFHLYNFQAMFDTGYTHFRVKDILTENQFLMSIPLADHPAYKNKKDKIVELEETIIDSKSKWLDDAICMRDESNQLIVFFDYGSKLWQKLINKKIISDKTKPPKKLPITDLANNLIKEYSQQKNDLLTMQWYVMISNCYAEEYVEKNELKSFTNFISNAKVIKSKKLAIAAGLKNYNERDGYLTRQSWKDEEDLSSGDNLDKQFILRFWFDLDITKDELVKAYEKEKLSQKELQKSNNKQLKIDLLFNQLTQFLNVENGWIQEQLKIEENENQVQWLWYKDSSHLEEGKFELDGYDDDYYRQLIKIEYDEREKGIHCNVGLQYGKILRWQKQQPDADPVYWHFKSNLLSNFDLDNKDNEKLVNYLGLWKYSLTSSNNKLQEISTIFSEYLKDESENLQQNALTEFNEKLFSRDCDQLVDLIENGASGTMGIIPDYVIFDLPAMIPLLFLFDAIDQVEAGTEVKQDKNVKLYFSKFKTSVEKLHPKGASKLYLENSVDLDKLISNGMPAVVQMEFIQYYRKKLDAKNA